MLWLELESGNVKLEPQELHKGLSFPVTGFLVRETDSYRFMAGMGKGINNWNS